jgi:hypothetical protein
MDVGEDQDILPLSCLYLRRGDRVVVARVLVNHRSNIDAVIGTTETAASATAGHEIPWIRMTSEAVKARTPPMVRFALHRFRSPLVLNASVMSNPFRKDSRLTSCGP